MKNKGILRSPILYTGGKYFLVKALLTSIPAGTTEILSPFFGGGAFEINAAYRGYNLKGFDIDANLVNFWQYWLRDAKTLDTLTKAFVRNHTRDEFREFQKIGNAGGTEIAFYDTLLQNAILFFAIAKLGYAGLGYRGNYIRKYWVEDGKIRFDEGRKTNKRVRYSFYSDNPSDTQKRLSFDEYKGLPLTVERKAFQEALTANPNAFVYADPPYLDSEYFYVTGEFNHEELADMLKARGNWLLSYNDCPEVRELYEGYRIMSVNRPYSMHGSANKEVLIFSGD